MTLHVAFVPGATPDKWARAWRERTREPLELFLVEESEQRVVLEDGRADMVLARLPLGGPEDEFHCVRLYEELPVVVVNLEHPASVLEELRAEDLSGEQFALGVPDGIEPAVPQLPFGPMSVKDAVEVAASGSAVVVLPMSVARLHHRKDVKAVVVTDLEPTRIGLVWRRQRDDASTQAFVGVVKGRTARSSRG
ncbi:LysR family transcriptional regulator substrate-binding protein [Nocardioides campestrisoli]|uniref:LysR family transcriptional regulator substrate-binding protein n=1 Tax=Nocardioides campestrisoli TaxID=2736757 RepID=UPI00163D7A44|nr:LysR family transcriptional regulator substrate-binding protein [Nocardioides campestrisoli]